MKTTVRQLLALLLVFLLCGSSIPAAMAGSAYDMGDQKLVALTFDDGPGPYSDWIMNTLQARGAKATFFMNGNLIQRYPAAVQRMAKEGFQLGNHTYNHPYLAKSSAATMAREITATANLITEITGVTGTGNTGFYLRPPYGSYNNTVVSRAGVPVIWCSVDSNDWKYDSASRLVSYTSSAVRDGDIVILHESHRSTAAGLGALVDKLQSMGYELVTVEELFWRRGITPQNSKLYYSARNTGINRCTRELYCDESKLAQHWAYDAISFVRSKGLMGDNRYGEFTPNFPLTRGMFVTALGRLAGVEPAAKDSGFSDIPQQHYAAAYAAWAKETGIMMGVREGVFDADASMTRQEIAVALMRYASWRGADTKAEATLPYSDADSIADWAKQGIAYCTGTGLLNGSDGAYRPHETATRAMGAVILQRLSAVAFPVPEDPETELPVESETEAAG